MEILSPPLSSLAGPSPGLFPVDPVLDNPRADYCVIDTIATGGVWFLAGYDTRPVVVGSLSQQFPVRPGDIIPVRGRRLWLLALAYGPGTTFGVSALGGAGVRLRLLQADEIAAWTLTNKELSGGALHAVESVADQSLAALGTKTIFDGDNYSSAFAVPVRVSGHMRGGNESVRSTNIRYPVELRLLVDSMVVAELLYPGHGNCSFGLDVPYTRLGETGAAGRWRLEAYNPNGAAVKITHTVALYGGHLGDRWTYRNGLYTAAAENDTNRQFYLNLTPQPARGSSASVAARLVNGASGAATLNWVLSEYLSSSMGGPALYSASSAATAASGTSFPSTFPTTPHYSLSAAYSAAPGAGVSCLASFVG